MNASVSFKSVGCRPSETGWSTTTFWTLLHFSKLSRKRKRFNIGVDIFKDAVSLPGVSMQYILRRTLRGRNAPELFEPGPEAYEMLKAAVVGGPSLVFTRKHENQLSQIRTIKHREAYSGVRCKFALP